MKRIAKSTPLGIILAALLASCATKPIPELMAVAVSDASPAIITGPQVAACVADNSFRKPYTVSEEGKYEPGYTYKFAERMHQGHPKVAAFADRVRAYSLVVHGTNFFRGKATGEVICYYELKDGELRYLLSLNPNRDGRVKTTEFNGAVLEAYARMAGKNVTKVRWFGVYAD